MTPASATTSLPIPPKMMLKPDCSLLNGSNTRKKKEKYKNSGRNSPGIAPSSD
ncbi:hypothetical protein Hanom_Chr06g00518901 [Helianthus anomalus]